MSLRIIITGSVAVDESDLPLAISDLHDALESTEWKVSVDLLVIDAETFDSIEAEIDLELGDGIIH